MESKINVIYRSCHLGHDDNSKGILNNEEESFIVERLKLGVPKKMIIEQTKSKFESFKIQTLDSKTLGNLELKHKIINEYKLDPDDAKSVDMFVQNASKYEVIILGYKRYGKLDEAYKVLDKDDLFLAFLTNYQKDFIQNNLKNDLKIVCMDASHGLNPYGFKLITIMVKDENHQGFPIAHCFSSKETKSAIKFFIESLKDEVGKLKSNWFMSDNAPQYYDAYIEAMHSKEGIENGLIPKKILCWWHVLRRLGANLNKIPVEKERPIVLDLIKSFRNELDAKEFSKKVEDFIRYLEKKQFRVFKFYGNLLSKKTRSMVFVL